MKKGSSYASEEVECSTVSAALSVNANIDK
jgi:hypothetical protein